jgi:molybdopterin converting factor small subunit
MPHVHLNLFAALRSHIAGAPSAELEIEPGQTIGELLDRLGIREEHTRMVFLDNRAARRDHRLQGGEVLDVFPALGGG